MAVSNTYAFNRPRARTMLVVPALYLLGYLSARYSGFLYVYQYSICVLIGILIGFFFDKDIISRNRLYGSRPMPVERISVFVSPFVIAAVLYIGIVFIWKTSLFYPTFSSHAQVSSLELFPLVLLVVAPITEILFRGFIQFSLAHMMNAKAALIITSLVHAGFFYYSGHFVLIVVYLPIAMYLSYLYYKHESVLLTIVNHMIILFFMFIFRF